MEGGTDTEHGVGGNLWRQHGLLCNLLLLQLRMQQQQAEDSQPMRTKALLNDCFHLLPDNNFDDSPSSHIMFH